MEKITIILELREEEFEAILSVISTCSAVMDQDETTTQEIEIIDQALKKNGFKRGFN